MDIPHPHYPLLIAATALLLCSHSATATASGWQLLSPPAAIVSSPSVGSDGNGGNGGNTWHASDTEVALTTPLSARIISKPAPGFLNQAFTPQQHNGKLGRIVDALGMGAIYNNPMVRNLLGRIRGSRFCVSDGCGINLKLSLRKPGLRFEHRF